VFHLEPGVLEELLRPSTSTQPLARVRLHSKTVEVASASQSRPHTIIAAMHAWTTLPM
jgi:hypothetical protein